MRAVLAAAVLMAFMPAVHAQDKGKSDMTTNAEFRVRDVFMQNESGDSGTKPTHMNEIEQRFKLGLGWKASEKFSFNASLLQGASWGQPSGDASVGDRAGASVGDANSPTAGDSKNFLAVNEAYATWMMTDMFHAKIGRMNYAFGDGSVMSTNDYQPQPLSFDGVTLNYELEFGKFTLFGFKYRDFSMNAAQTNSSDGQHDAYGLVFDLKTMPEWLKMVNVHVIQDVGDGLYGQAAPSVLSTAATTLNNINALRYGVNLGFNWGLVDLKADVEMVSGKQSAANGASGSEENMTQSMYQAQLGFNLPNLMMSRIHIGYHQDSGTSASDAATKNNTYDGYFHDLYSGSGNMQLVGWGNLTDINAGWDVKPMDSTTIGLAFHMFSKTQKDDYVHPGVYGVGLFNMAGTSAQNTANSSAIGSEWDLWAEHKYEGGFSMMADLGMFTPGGALKDSTINKGSTITQLTVAGKMTF